MDGGADSTWPWAARPMTFTDKVRELWTGIVGAKTILGDWRRENDAFLKLVEARTASAT